MYAPNFWSAMRVSPSALRVTPWASRLAGLGLALALGTAFATASAAAQATVAGRVSDVAGESLEGVELIIGSLRLSAVTGRDGSYRLVIPTSRLAGVTSLTLTARRIGFHGQRVEIQPVVGCEITQNFQLTADPFRLDEVVVTALGVEREKVELGYSVQEIEGAEITKVPELNLVNAIKGQVAGVHVTDAGPTGGTTRVVIRGSSSILGNNQPLFVVDGIPVDNSAPGAGFDRNYGYGAIDYGNTVQDIDPANIESISVLKGPTRLLSTVPAPQTAPWSSRRGPQVVSGAAGSGSLPRPASPWSNRFDCPATRTSTGRG
jgi:outer membrane receptor protein involved in Fe transport